ncbi:MAG: mismatch-specific DNA-glycosylase [Gammaproteobacteria bacterium]|nr:mismatch-specific DNA-glycosylase [Gammaproteobacteria bacterium]
MDTLPDYLSEGLYFISIGLNPSEVSVTSGYYFANPRNRFWKALNASRLINEPLEPGAAAMQILQDKYRIGFTDLVKRPTRTGKQLRTVDYRTAAPVLKEKLLRYQPNIAWFQGRDTYRHYLKFAENMETDIPWGAQKYLIGKSRIFVTPNPSPANAQYSLADLSKYYDAMVSYRIRELFGLGTS